jgi:hypothetical protein
VVTIFGVIAKRRIPFDGKGISDLSETAEEIKSVG